MKNMVMALVAGLVAFVLSMTGGYYLLPMFVPGIENDSLMTQADSLALDSIQQATTRTIVDSLKAVAEEKRWNTLLTNKDDSLAFFQHKLDSLLEANKVLLAENEKLQQQQAEKVSAQEEAARLSDVLTKLEDKDLANVLQNLDLEVLGALYEGASVRNRTRFLKAMQPDFAARFVRKMMGKDETSDSQTSMQDETLSTPPAKTIAVSGK